MEKKRERFEKLVIFAVAIALVVSFATLTAYATDGEEPRMTSGPQSMKNATPAIDTEPIHNPAGSQMLVAGLTIVPTCDGYIDAAEWADAYMYDISDTTGQHDGIADPLGTVFLWLKQDDIGVYFAVRNNVDQTLDDYDNIGLYFDDNHDGCFSSSATTEGNEWLTYHPTGSTAEWRWIQDVDCGFPPNYVCYGDNFGGGYTWSPPCFGIGIGPTGVVDYEIMIPYGAVDEHLDLTMPPDSLGFFIYCEDAAGSGFHGTWPSQGRDDTWREPCYYGHLICETGEEWPNHKMHFPQLPDLIGWDVYAVYPKTLADDWQCSQTGPITDIHFWGSWKNIDGDPWTDDFYTPMPWFGLSIHSNLPVGHPQNPYPWSIPGELLWWWDGEIQGTPFDPPTMESWYDPNLDSSICNDHVAYWRYDFFFDQAIPPPEPFYQYKDSIYWLNIAVEPSTSPPPYQWGWKTSRDHFMDDAVYTDNPPDGPWFEMYEPPRCNWFDVYFDATGTPEDMGSTNYYGAGWYRYEYWWNMWFYDNPFTYERPKEIFMDFWIEPVGPMAYAEFAINWSTPEWDELEMGRPPLPGEDEILYIGREVFEVVPGPNYIEYFIPYNPEWVSIDFAATDVIINGWIWHECVPTSMDLAFVITGPECTPSIDVEKKVWDEELQEWVDSTDVDVCNNVDFLITILNDGTCDLTEIFAEDFMDSSLEYVDAAPPPDIINPVPGGTYLEWNFPGPFTPGSTIDITVTAHVVGPVCHLDSNYVFVHAAYEPQAVEVYDEDVAYVHATQPDLDFGDAPDPIYPTLLANDGARHTIVPNVFLGALIDPEADGQPDPNALGDDNDGNDDEDGVVFTSLAVAGNPVNVKVTASVDGFLDGWVDFNFDGDWDEANEQVFVSEPLVAGVNFLTFNLPAATPIGITFSRFRFSTAGGLNYTGLAPDGEVEDYRVFIVDPIENPKMHWPQWPDLDNTGMDVILTVTPFLLALGDDWMCTQTGPVTDIHFWASFKDDILPLGGPGSLEFELYIWSDFSGPPSTPLDILWMDFFLPGDYSVHQVADNNPEDWYDPNTGLWLNDNHLQAYQYDFFIEDLPFEQDSGTVYWLVIVEVNLTQDYTFGWKTTEPDLRYRDDACWYDEMGGGIWLPMTYPVGHEYQQETLDLAFAITGSVPVICGDVNDDGIVNVGDIVYLVSYLYRGGPAPVPMSCVGDVNNDDIVNVGDIVYLVSYLYRGGPAPDPNCCNPPWKQSQSNSTPHGEHRFK
jgi:hypothetical protein